MAIKIIHRPPQNLWERLYVFEIARGLVITLKHALLTWFKPGHKRTFEYPEQRRPVANRFRGRHVLLRRSDGSPLCVACYCCQTVCPPKCIDIVAEESPDPSIEKRPKQFNLNLLRCIFCGMCVEACPKDAISMSTDYELSNETREQLYFGISDLLEPEKSEDRR